MEFLNLIKERYSCKKFDGRPIDESVLTAILEAGRLAPTAKNAQAQRVYVLSSPKALAALDSITPCRYGAPVVLAVPMIGTVSSIIREIPAIPGPKMPRLWASI